jgi:hypothetical protein
MPAIAVTTASRCSTRSATCSGSFRWCRERAARSVSGAPGLGTAGSAWDLDFSVDPMQTFMFEVDGGNEILHIMSRTMGTILGGFGQPGLHQGQFTFLHSVNLDSKGNLYTGETINGRRIQKFVRTECNNGKGKGHGKGNCD